MRAAGVFLLLSPHTELLSWASCSPSSLYTGSCEWSGSERAHDGWPCRSTPLLSSSSPGSGSGCWRCCSFRSSPPLSWSGPPPSPLCRPPPSSPRLPEESTCSAGRPAWRSPQRAAQRREGAERRRVCSWSRLEGRAETHTSTLTASDKKTSLTFTLRLE